MSLWQHLKITTHWNQLPEGAVDNQLEEWSLGMLVNHIYCCILWRKVINSEWHLLRRKPAFITIRLFLNFNFWKTSRSFFSEILRGPFEDYCTLFYNSDYSLSFFLILKLKLRGVCFGFVCLSPQNGAVNSYWRQTTFTKSFLMSSPSPSPISLL